MKNNIIPFPSSSTVLHNTSYRVTDELIDHVWDALKTPTKRQMDILKKRIETAEEIEKYLPNDKKDLLENYDSLFSEDNMILVDNIIKYMVEHESEIKDIIVGY